MTEKRRAPLPRSQFRKTLVPYASDAALTGLQVIFLFVLFHDSELIKSAIYIFAVVLGVWGSVPLLRSLLGRSRNAPFSLAVFQRSLPSVLLLGWGESHFLNCSYIPYNRLAVMVWLVYVAVGVFFGAVRANHRLRLRREMRLTEQQAEYETEAQTTRGYETVSIPYRSAFSPSPVAAEQETVIAGRS